MLKKGSFVVWNRERERKFFYKFKSHENIVGEERRRMMRGLSRSLKKRF